VSGNLDLTFTTTLTTNDAGAGFYFDLVFGNSTLDSGRPPGDYNRDGSVTSADYDVWKSTFGSTSNLNADGNKDGIVDLGDYTISRDRLGIMGPGSGAGNGAAVPEPSTLLLALGLLALVHFNRRHNGFRDKFKIGRRWNPVFCVAQAASAVAA